MLPKSTKSLMKELKIVTEREHELNSHAINAY